MAEEVTIGYWDCRGRVGLILALLDYCKVPYKLHLYPHSKFEDWGAIHKPNLKADFANLPYLVDGNKILTETIPLVKYIAVKGHRKDLLGKNFDDEILVETALNVAKDIFEIVDVACYTKNDFEAEKDKIFNGNKLKGKLSQFNTILEGKEWICGYLTAADFSLFEDVDFIYEMDSSRLEPYPNLIAFHKRFMELPETKAHRQSEKFIQRWLPLEATWTNVPGHGKKEEKELILGYWNCKGRGQPAWYLLEHCKIPYKEKRYEKYEEWLQDKEALGLDFPNLPYLIHGDKKITEAMAIYEYIASISGKNELNGTDEDTQVNINMLNGVLFDLFREIAKLVFFTPKESFVELKEKSWTEGVFKEKMTRLSKYLEGKEYLCGKMTVPDFTFFNIVDLLSDLDGEKVNEYPNVIPFHKRMSEIPEIKAFRDSERNPKVWFPTWWGNWSHNENAK